MSVPASAARQSDLPRVAHVIDSGGLYGAEQVVLTLMAAQARAGLSTVLYSLGEPGAGPKALERSAAERGLVVRAVRMRRGPNWFGALRVLRECLGSGVQLLHLHGYRADILFGGIPRRWRVLPAISTLHGWTSVGPGRMRVYEWLDARVLDGMERVVVVSRAMLEHAALRDRALPIEVVPNAIGDAVPGGMDLQAHWRAAGEPGYCVATIGRLSAEKGQAVLLHALRTLVDRGVDARLVMFGEGPERAALASLAAQLGLSGRVRLAGYVADAGSVLPAFRAFVLPSLTEGLPITALEAMRAGVPVVASAVGGLPELLEHGRAGMLVPPGDSPALATALGRLAADPASGQALARRAQEVVAASHTPEVMARRYLEIYRSVLGGA